MGAAARLGSFAALMVAVFGAAALLGGALDPDATSARAEADGGHGSGGHAEAAAGEHAAAAALPGLATAQDGYRLVVDRVDFPAPGRHALTFRIEDERGAVVRAFDVLHAKRLHFIVVRRDLTRFAHLHPEMAADGTWSTRVDFGTGGTYRVFADFTIDGRQRTLGADVNVGGAFAPKALSAPASSVEDDHGLTVRRRKTAGATVAFDVLRDGRVVNDELQEYLGAKGHLVTLRAGDLAYLHTHPEGDRLAFLVDLPGPGAYRSWVQFRLDGRVHTAAFSEEASP